MITTVLPAAFIFLRTVNNRTAATKESAVFIPILLATSLSTLAGLLSVAFTQKLSIFNRVVFAYIGGFALFIVLIACYFSSLPNDMRITVSSTIGNFILFFIIALFITAGAIKKINVYETFIKGAKEGFDIAVKIIPYLVAMLTAIAAFRTSGLMQCITDGFAFVLNSLNL